MELRDPTHTVPLEDRPRHGSAHTEAEGRRARPIGPHTDPEMRLPRCVRRPSVDGVARIGDARTAAPGEPEVGFTLHNHGRSPPPGHQDGNRVALRSEGTPWRDTRPRATGPGPERQTGGPLQDRGFGDGPILSGEGDPRQPDPHGQVASSPLPAPRPPGGRNRCPATVASTVHLPGRNLQLEHSIGPGQRPHAVQFHQPDHHASLRLTLLSPDLPGDAGSGGLGPGRPRDQDQEHKPASGACWNSPSGRGPGAWPAGMHRQDVRIIQTPRKGQSVRQGCAPSDDRYSHSQHEGIPHAIRPTDR